MSAKPTANSGPNPNRVSDKPLSSVPKINQMILEANKIAEETEGMFTNILGQTVGSQEQMNASLGELGVASIPTTRERTQKILPLGMM